MQWQVLRHPVWCLDYAVLLILRLWNVVKTLKGRSFVFDEILQKENAVVHLFETLRYKLEGRRFDWHNPSGHTMALESTQSLTEMSTRNISWG